MGGGCSKLSIVWERGARSCHSCGRIGWVMKFWAGQTWQQGGRPRGVILGGIVLLGGMSRVILGGNE